MKLLDLTNKTIQVFEKKNQKSAQTIAQLQKKLENYQKKVRDIEQGTMPNSKPPKEVLKDVVKKPIQLGHWLKKNKFGSADNIPKEGAWSEGESVGKESTPVHQRNHHGHKRTQSGHVGGNWGASSHVKHTSASLPRDTGHAGSGGGSVGGSASGHGRGHGHIVGAGGSTGDSGASDVTSESDPHVTLDVPGAGQQQLPIPVHVTGGDPGSRRQSGVNITERDPGVGGHLGLQSIMDEIHER